MNGSMRCPQLRIAAGLALVCVAPAEAWAQDQPPAAVSDDIPTVIVRPDRDDPLSESDRKLKALMKSLPGADDAVVAKKGVGERVGQWYDAHRDPNQMSAESRRQMLQHMGREPDVVPDR